LGFTIDLREDGGPVSFAKLIDRGFNEWTEAELILRRYGVRLEPGDEEDRFWVASSSDLFEREIFAGTPWRKTWRFALRTLPGARHSKNYKVGRTTARGYSLSETYLEPFLRGQAQA
jgi:hypothetical protein